MVRNRKKSVLTRSNRDRDLALLWEAPDPETAAEQVVPSSEVYRVFMAQVKRQSTRKDVVAA